MKNLGTRVFAMAAGVLCLAISAFAADIDGKWNGTMSTPMGDVPVAFVFQSDGAKLAGSTTGPDGAEIKIADGKVNGGDVSFSVTFDFGGMPLKMDYAGKLAGNEIKFKIDIFGMPFDLVVKKSS